MALVFVEVKDALDEVLLDNVGLAVQKSLSYIKQGQVAQVLVVVAGQLKNAEEESTPNFQIIFLQKMEQQNQRLLSDHWIWIT